MTIYGRQLGSILHLPDEIGKKRSDFLKKLYEFSDGTETKFLSMWEIGDQLGFDRDLTIFIVQYLKAEGLIQFRALGGIISITHYGIKEAERSLNNIQSTKQIQKSEQQENITNSFPKGNTIQQFWSEIQNRYFWKYELKVCCINLSASFSSSSKYSLYALSSVSLSCSYCSSV